MENTSNVPEQSQQSTNPSPQTNPNMKICKACGAQIAKNAKSCPSCGAKNKKPIYKRWYFYALILVLVVIVLSVSGNDDEPKPAADTGNMNAVVQAADEGNAAATKTPATQEGEQIEYTTVAIETLFDELETNAYNAQQRWNGQYITITGGKVSTIDASGEYFSIESSSDAYWLQSIHVSLPRSMRDEVMQSISSGASVTVSCKVTTVGEVMGYMVDATAVTV